MIYACSFLEGADVQLLPASYRALESDLGLSPSTLAAANLFQGITLAVFSVFWGVLSDNGILAPHQILFGGCTGWGILTLLTAAINDTSWILIIRLFNGVALATLSPTTQALIASIAPPQERGRYFCWLGFMLGFGAMVTAIMTTAISNLTIYPGVKGWRVAFAIIGLVSIVLGNFVKRFAVLPADLAHWEEKIEKEKIEPETPGGEPLSFTSELKTMIRFFEARTGATAQPISVKCGEMQGLVICRHRSPGLLRMHTLVRHGFRDNVPAVQWRFGLHSRLHLQRDAFLLILWSADRRVCRR